MPGTWRAVGTGVPLAEPAGFINSMLTSAVALRDGLASNAWAETNA